MVLMKSLSNFDRWTFMMQEDLKMFYDNKENYENFYFLGYH